jgi:hypothetical protein
MDNAADDSVTWVCSLPGAMAAAGASEFDRRCRSCAVSPVPPRAPLQPPLPSLVTVLAGGFSVRLPHLASRRPDPPASYVRDICAATQSSSDRLRPRSRIALERRQVVHAAPDERTRHWSGQRGRGAGRGRDPQRDLFSQAAGRAAGKMRWLFLCTSARAADADWRTGS